jgi:hypothetical protein
MPKTRRSPTGKRLRNSSGKVSASDRPCCCFEVLDCHVCGMTCATVVLAAVDLCPDVNCLDLGAPVDVCDWHATGDPNGTYELPHCLPDDGGGFFGCVAAEAFCDVVTIQTLKAIDELGSKIVAWADVLNIKVELARFKAQRFDDADVLHEQIFYWVFVTATVDSNKLNCCYQYVPPGIGTACRCHGEPVDLYGDVEIADVPDGGIVAFRASKIYFDDCPIDSAFTVDNESNDGIAFDSATGIFSIVTTAGGAPCEFIDFSSGTATVTLHTTPDASCPSKDCTCSNEGGECNQCTDINAAPAYWTATFAAVTDCADLCPPSFPACDLKSSTADLTAYTLQQTVAGCSWNSPVCMYSWTHCNDTVTVATYAIGLRFLPGLIEVRTGNQIFRLAVEGGINCASSYVIPLAPDQPTSCGDSDCGPFIAQSVTITPGPGPDPCGSTGGCDVACETCGHDDVLDADCAYCPATATLELMGSVAWGICDDCALGIDGTGCCVNNSPASECKVCGGPAGIDCTCINVADKADCLGNGWTLCCRNSSGGSQDGVSPCDFQELDDIDVVLPLVSHTSTTQVYELTSGGVHYKVTRTCGVAFVADVFDVEITKDGRCKAFGTIGGTCTGFGGSLEVEDTGETNGECTGGGGGAVTATLFPGVCP